MPCRPSYSAVRDEPLSLPPPLALLLTPLYIYSHPSPTAFSLPLPPFRVQLACHVQPVTRTLLKFDLTITPDFKWDDKVRDRQGGSHESVCVRKRGLEREHDLSSYPQVLPRFLLPHSSLNFAPPPPPPSSSSGARLRGAFLGGGGGPGQRAHPLPPGQGRKRGGGMGVKDEGKSVGKDGKKEEEETEGERGKGRRGRSDSSLLPTCCPNTCPNRSSGC